SLPWPFSTKPATLTAAFFDHVDRESPLTSVHRQRQVHRRLLVRRIFDLEGERKTAGLCRRAPDPARASGESALRVRPVHFAGLDGRKTDAGGQRSARQVPLHKWASTADPGKLLLAIGAIRASHGLWRCGRQRREREVRIDRGLQRLPTNYVRAHVFTVRSGALVIRRDRVVIGARISESGAPVRENTREIRHAASAGKGASG